MKGSVHPGSQYPGGSNSPQLLPLPSLNTKLVGGREYKAAEDIVRADYRGEN